jgi:branched-chain amino acid transport system permease protein
LSALAGPGTSFSQRLQSAIADSFLAAIIAFALFGLLLGLRTVDNVTGLTLEGRPALLAIVVGIVFFGRVLLNLFVWQAEHPLTAPFARLFTSEKFDARDRKVLGSTAFGAVIVFVGGILIGSAACQLVAGFVLAFMGVGLLRRIIAICSTCRSWF